MVGKLFRNLYQKKVVVLVLLVIILITVAIGGYLYFNRDTNPIPKQLRSQLTFSPFVIPVNTKGHSTSDYEFNKTDDGTQILKYEIHFENNVIIISQYPQPPQFSEIPDFKNQWLNNTAQQYSSVSSSSGTIYLGRAVKQNNKQLAIMIERGLLVFLSPDKKLTEQQWRSLGDQLEIQKIGN